MTTTEYLLNFALLAFILVTNLGTHRVTRRRLVLPLVLVAVAASAFLRHVPTIGHDLTLELLGVAAGAVLGVVAGLLVHVHRDHDGTTTTAGLPYAALWVAVIGGRVLFAYGAEHWWSRSIGMFSMQHQITGADAWASAFILMALTMVLARVAVTAAQAALAHRPSMAVAG